MSSQFGYDPVSIASHIFLTKYNEQIGVDPSGVLFNKYMTLLHRDGDHKGLMKLPHCWYRWGDEVVRYHMRNLEWNHEEAGFTKVGWRGSPPRYVPEDPFVSIASVFADEFIGKYSGDNGHELAIDEVYRDAPFPFQNEYRKVRENLKEHRKNEWISDNYRDSMLLPMFNRAMDCFPDEFAHIARTKEQFRKVFMLAVRSDSTPEMLYDMVEDFWFFFCYHLRIQCNENVPRSTILFWEEKLPWEDEMYSRNLQDKAFEFVPEDTVDPLLIELLEQRRLRVLESEEVFDLFSNEDLDGLRDFVKDLRTGK